MGDFPAFSPSGEEVLMTPAEIADYNRAIFRAIGAGAGLLRPEDLRAGLSRETLLAWIGRARLPEGPLYRGTARLTAAERAALLARRNLPGIADPVAIRWGICTRRAALRHFPCGCPLTRCPDDRYDDANRESTVPPGRPLAVLHTSRDGAYRFVLCEDSMGWMEHTALALCPDYERWKAAQDFPDFLTVLESHMRLCADPYAPAVSDLELGMGTRLPLAAPPGTVLPLRHRMSYDSYVVEVPTRGSGGALAFTQALLPVSRDVCRGFLPYTRSAVLRLAGRTRGEVYGWGGMLGSRDCSGLVQELFSCFGFRLPRNSADLARLPGRHNLDLAACTPAEKRALLARQPPGVLLYFPGHILIYCGTREGCPLCISAAGRFLPPGAAPGQGEAEVNSVVLTSLEVVRPNGKTWLESLTRIIRIEP